MDLGSVMGKFFTEDGDISIAKDFNLTDLYTEIYDACAKDGDNALDKPVLRFWDYSSSQEGDLSIFSRREFNTRIKTVAARLQQVGRIGEHVAILAGNSPEYLYGFMGIMHAGMTPIPLYDPREPGHSNHLKAVFSDANPTIVLTNRASAPEVRAHFSSLPGKERPRIMAVDALPDTLAAQYEPVKGSAKMQEYIEQTGKQPVEQPAFMQYTSGSTRRPAGVLLTHRSILTNVLQSFLAAPMEYPFRSIIWLPLHHDMGIISGLFALILAQELELMSPRDFIQQPSRWIKQLSHKAKVLKSGEATEEEVPAGIYTTVPTFALELAVRYGKREEADFSEVNMVGLGSEPITEYAVNNFVEAFRPYGMREEIVRPGYGLAEASLIVSTPRKLEPPQFRHLDRTALAEGKAVVVEPSENSVAYAGNGQLLPAQPGTIVDPETKKELPDGYIGELWIRGGNMAAGYYERPEETAKIFRNRLEKLPENSRVPDAPDDDYWMATGDLATLIDDHLFITGRLKDLIVIAGRNHYPQDIEGTVQESSDQVRADSVASFAIEGDDTEQLVILVERADDADPANDAEAVKAIRTAVSSHHGVTPADIVFMGEGEIPRSSSGKIARRIAKKHYLEG